MPEPLLQARGLGKRFPGTAWALREVDFRLAAGELAVLAGRNGAGKTVLAKILAGLLEPSEGEVLFGGAPLLSYPESPAARVGYVFQDARLQLVGETVQEDLRFGPESLGLGAAEAAARAEVAMGLCGLSERRQSPVHALSGGEQRRLALAGVLALSPAAIILDEPFANLDRDGVSSVLRVLKTLVAEGIALLVVTHELEKLLGMADRLAVMDRGRIVLAGEPGPTLAAGIERFGLRDPLRPASSVGDLLWLD